MNINIVDRKYIEKNDFFHPGKSAELILEGKSIGIFSQIHPGMIESLGLPKETYIFHIYLSPIIDSAVRKNKWIV